MNKNLYIPFWISITAYCASLLIAFFMKELDQNTDSHRYIVIADQEYSTSVSGEPVFGRAAMSLPALAHDNSRSTESQKLLKLHLQQIAGLFNSPASHFCLAAFFVKRVAFASESFVFQYASEKFLWPLYKTTYLRVATASGAVFVTLIACPVSFSLLSRKGFPADMLDLNAVRISLIIVFLSFFCAWKANSGLQLIWCTSQGALLMKHCLMLTKIKSNGWLWTW